MDVFTSAVITVSDRGFRGETVDESGPILCGMLERAGFEIVLREVVPDDAEAIKTALCSAVDKGDIALILTTGGTGFAPRDVTPEATIEVCERMTPGISEAMRMRCLEYTMRAMLSRGVSGIRGRSLIINLPGSPKAARENLEVILSSLEHGLTMLRSKPMNCAEIND